MPESPASESPASEQSSHAPSTSRAHPPLDDALERLLERSVTAALQTANELRTLVEMLQLLLQRFRLQALRLESELARLRAEHASLVRALEQQEAAWEARQQLERERAQAHRQAEEERAALRAAAEEEARRIRLAAEQEAAALLAAAQARRAELLVAWSRSQERTCTPEPPAEGSPPAAPPASGTAYHTGDAPPAPAAEGQAAAALAVQTEVAIRRVPDTRRAAALQAAIAALPGVTHCRLREFARGRLILNVEHHLGRALADRLRTLPAFDLRLISARDGSLELQLL
ncbi:MAG TPA: hypothetical protein VFB73_01040 [Chloroflexota bacterium]|nr:hypothetical protein [Chloroflexota bacterium]